MIKGDLYYRFLAPMFVTKKGLALTQENIDAEIKNLKALDNIETETKEIIYNNSDVVDLSNANKDTTSLQIISDTINIARLDISSMFMLALEKIIAPKINLFFDAYNKELNYSGIKHIDVHSLSSKNGSGLIGADFTALKTLIIRSEYIVAGLYDFLHNSSIINGKGHIYVPDKLLEVYKLQYADTPTILNAIKPISEIE